MPRRLAKPATSFFIAIAALGELLAAARHRHARPARRCPGDLGGPILEAQNSQPVPIPAPSRRPSIPASSAGAPKTKPPASAASSSRAKTARLPRTPLRQQARMVRAWPVWPANPGRRAGAQDRQLAFLNAGVDRRTVWPDRVMPPASPFVLQAGAVIPAALITGIPLGPPRPDQRPGDEPV